MFCYKNKLIFYEKQLAVIGVSHAESYEFCLLLGHDTVNVFERLSCRVIISYLSLQCRGVLYLDSLVLKTHSTFFRILREYLLSYTFFTSQKKIFFSSEHIWKRREYADTGVTPVCCR